MNRWRPRPGPRRPIPWALFPTGGDPVPDPRADDDRRPKGGWPTDDLPPDPARVREIVDVHFGLVEVRRAHDRLIEAHGKEYLRRLGAED